MIVTDVYPGKDLVQVMMRWRYLSALRGVFSRDSSKPRPVLTADSGLRHGFR
jgi:hypothetical protein